MNDPFEREVAVFGTARRLPAGERAAYLDEACAGDAALRRRVEQLLQAGEQAEGFLQEPAPGAQRPEAAAGVPTLVLSITAPGEELGDRIDRYKLLQQIGEGGCGVVYMAEQEEPVRRRVALKVIKLGMDTKQVIARFEAERQALAMMDHANIAKVLDAGTTETGRPYFVMELVRGIKITDYCDEHNLSTQERLELFMQVCHAVQHAHQKGVIHRDLKPSNILVASDDGMPVPKVIDFGIAKATQGRLTNQTLFTAFEQFIGTPAYMSPEQAELTMQDVDTRTDIYSLGVLLYELLTGRTPFDAQELLASGLDAMRRTIREIEPVKPSTKLTQELVGDDVRSLHSKPPKPKSAEEIRDSSRRLLQKKERIRQLRGDLDWIVMKCLEKDRARRYDTANGLANEVRRHMNCEPVLARPPSRLYEFQKTVRRHKFGFAAGATLILVLAAGVLASTWEATGLKRAERIAVTNQKKSESEAAKATAVGNLLNEMLNSANPEALKGSDYTVRQMLDDFSDGLESRFKHQPEVEAEVRATLGRAYWRLGLAGKAEPQMERALALRRWLFGEHEQVAATLVDYAWVALEQDRIAKGEALAREALAIYAKRGITGQPVISALWILQQTLIRENRTAEVDAVTEQALNIAGKVEFPELASMLHGLTWIRNGQSRYAEGEAWGQKAVAMHKRLRREGDLETAWALLNLGVSQSRQRKFTEAEAVLREALGIFRKQYSDGHKSVDFTINELREVLVAKGDSAGLDALERERLAETSRRIIRDQTVAQAWVQLCLADADRKEWQAVTQHFGMALVLCKEQSSTTRKTVGEACLQLAGRAQQAAQLEIAERVNGEAVALFRQLAREDAKDSTVRQDLENSLHSLADIVLGEGNGAKAEDACRESVPLIKDLLQSGVEPGYAAVLIERLATDSLRLAGLLRQAGKLAEADTTAREAVQSCRAAMAQYGYLAPQAVHDHGFWSIAIAYETLAEMLKALGQPQEAEKAYLDAQVLWRKLVAYANSEDYRFHLALNHDQLGSFLGETGRKPESLENYREAQAIWLKLVVEFNNEDRRMHLGWTDEALGRLLSESRRLDEAAEVYGQALAVWRKLVADFKKEDYRNHLSGTLANLCGMLREEGKAGEAETLERELADSGNTAIQNDIAWRLATAPDPKNRDGTNAVVYAEKAVTATSHTNASFLDTLAAAYAEAAQFTNAVRLEREAIALLRDEAEQKDCGSRLKLYESNTPYREHGLLAERALALLGTGHFAEAEVAARDCLKLREKQIPDDWRTSNARSLLGGALLGQKKFADAEPLLLAGYEGLRQREDKIPKDSPRLKEALQRLVQLCEAKSQPDQAAQWKHKLAELDKSAK